jgi:hypothetical protein
MDRGGGGQKQGGAQRYGVAAVQVTGEENVAVQASSPTTAGMHEMKAELAAISSAFAAIGAKKGGKENRQGPLGQEGRESSPAVQQAGQAQGALQGMQWVNSTPGTGSSVTTADNGANISQQNARKRR